MRSLTALLQSTRAALFGAITIALGPACGVSHNHPVGVQAHAQLGPRSAVRESPSPTVATDSPSPAADGVYAATTATSLQGPITSIMPRVYVPNNGSNTVDVIDPFTFQVVDHYPVGQGPHHIAPAWDLSELYVDNELSSTLTVIDVRTGKPSRTIPVERPYNLYFTPDGQKAIVVNEAYNRLDFYDPHTWKQLKQLPIRLPGHSGIDHLDFSADGSYLLASTEFTGQLVKVDVGTMEMAGSFALRGLPIDVRLSPDGSVFYVTNQGRNGVSVIDPIALKEVAFIPTGRGAHGLQVSRNTKSLYVSNRLEGTVSVIDFASRKLIATWRIGGSPDMMQLSLDGSQLWTASRFTSAVYVVNTGTGEVIHTIPVGIQPHGLTYFPNPGHFSIGHNGVYR